MFAYQNLAGLKRPRNFISFFPPSPELKLHNSQLRDHATWLATTRGHDTDDTHDTLIFFTSELGACRVWTW